MNAITSIIAADYTADDASTTRIELLNTPGQAIFAAAAPDMVANGWSVFPQELNRMPGMVYGATIKVAEDHDLKHRLPTPKAMDDWNNSCATLNVACVFGSGSGNTFAIDIDVLDEQVASEIAAMADEKLGYSPLRREGRFPKIALIYRHAAGEENRVANTSANLILPVPSEEEDPDGSRRKEIAEDEATGEGRQIEIQGFGKQLTFAGRHHKTGCYFKWLDQSPQMVGPEVAPLVTKEQVEAFMAEVIAIYGTAAAKGNKHRPMRMCGVGNGKKGYLITPNLQVENQKRIKDGRETLLRDMAFHIVRCNPSHIKAAKAQGDNALKDLEALMVAEIHKQFTWTAEMSGRWNSSFLTSQATAKVRANIRNLIAGRIKPDTRFEAQVKAKIEECRVIEVAAEREVVKKKETQAALEAAWSGRTPYVALGCDDGVYYFLDMMRQVRGFKAAQLTTVAGLLELDDDFDRWHEAFPGQKGSIHVQRAGADLMRQARAAGVYSGNAIRGRGVWWVKDRAVVHLGDKLLVDGKAMQPGRVGGAIFPRGPDMNVNTALTPLTAEEASQLTVWCNGWQWRQQEGMSRLAAGAIASATICGGLSWRTHFFVSAEAGSGKTEFMKQIVNRILGGMALDAMGDSTAIGLQQTLKFDALPVTMDEPETQSDADMKRVAAIISLARKASSEGGAATIKGSPNHQATSFRTSSMFFLAAINNPLVQTADLTRWISLDMVVRGTEAERADAWKATQAELAANLTDDFGARLMLRMVSLLPVIRANTETFCVAISKSGGGTARMGKTLGNVLACAWALESEDLVTDADAADFVASTDWMEDAISVAKVSPDWEQAIGKLVQHRVEVINGNGLREMAPLGELFQAAIDGGNLIEPLKTAFSRAGIKFEKSAGGLTFTILNKSVEIAKCFAGTPWAASWAKTLERAPGTSKPVGNIYVSGHTPGRATIFPGSLFTGD
jgi:putative DNA primase/helicase